LRTPSAGSSRSWISSRRAKYLEEAEKRIELLTKDEAGLLKTQPFEWDKDAQG
jgi:hypothetical protein